MGPSALIDLSALRHNLQRARAAAPNSRVIAVIKADAYGHGMLRAAQALSTADAFGVARVEEGVALREAGMACIEEDGAQVICMGSTTMHQAVPYLQSELPVPVINPGPLSYKLAELVLGLGVSHSKKAWPAPNVPKPEMLEAMMEAAARSEQVVA